MDAAAPVTLATDAAPPPVVIVVHSREEAERVAATAESGTTIVVVPPPPVPVHQTAAFQEALAGVSAAARQSARNWSFGSAELRAKERSRAIRGPKPGTLRTPRLRPAAPLPTGRNAACPCGSGKKYKNCHRSQHLAG